MGLKISLVFLFITVLWLNFSGCSESAGQKEAVVLTLNQQLAFDEDLYKSVIQEEVLNNDHAVWNDSLTLPEIYSISNYYRSKEYEPQLISSFEDTAWFNTLTQIILNAESHGLKISEYSIFKIRELYSRALILDSMDVRGRHLLLAGTDLLLSSSLCKLASHLKYGRVNPYKIYSDGFYLPLPDSAGRDFTEPLESGDVKTYFSNLMFRNSYYNGLVHKTTFFKNLLPAPWTPLTYFPSKLKFLDKDTQLPALAKRLALLGFLDTAGVILDTVMIFDSLIIRSVSSFQVSHGLIPDGVPGKNTIDRLNVKPSEYLKSIYINLERMRWTHYRDSSEYVLVNIPEFMVHSYRGGKSQASIKVCVGKKRSKYYDELLARYKKTLKPSHRPENWQTPQLYSQFTYVVLNPTWTVPPSIVREEIYSEFLKDSTYLTRKKFKVYLKNEEIPGDQVDLKKYGRENIPYSFVQSPDPYNALGKIKFMFKNPFGVYLHDTPTRAPFGYANRAVSHGCVRVEKPYQFAEYLVEEHSKWNITYVKVETGAKVDDEDLRREYAANRSEIRGVGRDQKTTTIRMEKQIPLFIDYITAWVDSNGKFQFREDVYAKDEALVKGLNLR